MPTLSRPRSPMRSAPRSLAECKPIFLCRANEHLVRCATYRTSRGLLESLGLRLHACPSILSFLTAVPARGRASGPPSTRSARRGVGGSPARRHSRLALVFGALVSFVSCPVCCTVGYASLCNGTCGARRHTRHRRPWLGSRICARAEPRGRWLRARECVGALDSVPCAEIVMSLARLRQATCGSRRRATSWRPRR